MPNSSRFAVLLRVVLLPLALTLGAVLGLGSHYETSDDASLGWLFAGVLALKPVASVPLYFHGYGHVLAAAYTAMPNVPWIGLLLGGLLAGATILTFAVLDRGLRPHLRPGPLALFLTVFFGVAWVEHWLWFSYVRVALLLAGSALLFAAQRPGRWGALLLGLAGLGAAWLMRPSLAVLALGAVLPAAVLLAGGWRRAVPVVGSAALALALATGAASLLRTNAEAHTQIRDAYFARILDFDQLRPAPRTPADSLGTAAIGLWIMGDSTVANEALCRRAYRFDAADFLGREVPAKLRLRASLLVRDYFPLLLALAATAVGVVRGRSRQRWFWLVQLGFIGGLALLAGLLKLPPRLELPLLDFWLINNLAFWLLAPHPLGVEAPPTAAGPALLLRLAPPTRGLVAVVALLVIGLYGAKTWHRRQVLGQEQQRHEYGLRQIARLGAGHVRILAGTTDLLKSLSPFRAYTLGPGPLLVLTGWPSHDASQARLRQALSGSADQTECLRRLAHLKLADPTAKPVWVLTPETARWLSRRFRLDGPRLLLYPEPEPIPYGTSSPVRVYHVQDWPEH